jgi:hypothetical protein
MTDAIQILNDRITVNQINGKSEAVTALVEVREAILAKQDSLTRAIRAANDRRFNPCAELRKNNL